MFLLFGTRASETVLTVVHFVCQFCGHAAPQRVMKRTNRFTLFFIPLFSFGSSFLVECSNCGGATGLTRQQAEHGVEWAAQNRTAG